MKNSKLVEEAKQNPTRIYQRPHDVLRDRRLDDAARLEILASWAQIIHGLDGSETALTRLEELRQARRELEQRLHPQPYSAD